MEDRGNGGDGVDGTTLCWWKNYGRGLDEPILRVSIVWIMLDSHVEIEERSRSLTSPTLLMNLWKGRGNPPLASQLSPPSKSNNTTPSWLSWGGGLMMRRVSLSWRCLKTSLKEAISAWERSWEGTKEGKIQTWTCGHMEEGMDDTWLKMEVDDGSPSPTPSHPKLRSDSKKKIYMYM